LYQLIAFAVNGKFHSIQALRQKNVSPSSLWAIILSHQTNVITFMWYFYYIIQLFCNRPQKINVM